MTTLSAVILELKVRRIGNAVGVVLPREALEHLRVKEGDTICVAEASDGTLRITPAGPEVTQPQLNQEVTRQLETAQDLVRRYRNAVRELDT